MVDLMATPNGDGPLAGLRAIASGSDQTLLLSDLQDIVGVALSVRVCRRYSDENMTDSNPGTTAPKSLSSTNDARFDHIPRQYLNGWATDFIDRVLAP
jgi:hypothetical protein